MEGEEKIPLATRIAALVHAHFDALPARYKPRTRDDGSREWIPMSGFVVVQGT
jgi:tRNA-specific adenosine deaminase 1